jgi:polyphenol oxidase
VGAGARVPRGPGVFPLSPAPPTLDRAGLPAPDGGPLPIPGGHPPFLHFLSDPCAMTPSESTSVPGAATPVSEVPGTSAGLATLVRRDWDQAFPWLAQGTTTRELDFRLWGGSPGGRALEAWEALREASGACTVVHARQVHGGGVRFHDGGAPGLHLVPPVDGHMTCTPGVLLAVTVADCVPVFLVAERPRAVAVLHAGWRGVAEGILEAGIRGFQERLGLEPEALHLHLGPAIGGPAYEVGPEVHRALGREDPGVPTPLDLRAILVERALRAGVLPARIGYSERCTRTDPLLFSHRGGDAMRQVAFAMIRSRGSS